MRTVAAALALALWSCGAQAQDITWQDAVARLAGLKSGAVDCAASLKASAAQKPDLLARASFDYGQAKAEVDAVIAGLSAALTEGDDPGSLDSLEARLEKGFEARQALCRRAEALLPKEDETPRNPVLAAALEAAVGPLIDAAKEIWFRHLDDTELRRQTIRTQIESQTWPRFADIS